MHYTLAWGSWDSLSTSCSNNKFMSNLWNVYKTAAANLIPVPELQGLLLLIQRREIVGQVLKTAVLSLQISLTSEVPTAGHMCFAVCPSMLFFPLSPFKITYLILCERFKAFDQKKGSWRGGIECTKIVWMYAWAVLQRASGASSRAFAQQYR